MYDVIVMGVGSMGSSACYQLAEQGLKVLGLEQFSIVHEEGSHTGQSRLIRKAYFEHPDYVPLLESAYQGWKKLEQESGEQLYWPTGIAYFGLPNDEIILGVQESAGKYNIPLELKKPDQYPELTLPKDFTCVLEPEAGFISPQRSIGVSVRLAREHGAEILESQKVLGWHQYGDEIIVQTAHHEFRTKKLVLTAGPFAQELVELPMKVTRQYLGWADTTSHRLGDFPCWVISDERPGIFYGFPAETALEGPRGMKIGYHQPGDDPSSPDQSAEERALLNNVLRQYFVEDLKVNQMKTCKYTYSLDEHFIIDALPDTNNQVFVATGFSGHGFKFVPVIGEVLADLVTTGTTSHPTDFLRLKRFYGRAQNRYGNL